MNEKIIIVYGEENLTINKGENHIILTPEEIQFLIKSLLNNIKIQ